MIKQILSRLKAIFTRKPRRKMRLLIWIKGEQKATIMEADKIKIHNNRTHIIVKYDGMEQGFLRAEVLKWKRGWVDPNNPMSIQAMTVY